MKRAGVLSAAFVSVGCIGALLAGGFPGSSSGEATTSCPALTQEKRDLLPAIGVSPEEYCREQVRADARRLALANEPPPDPQVVAPRLIDESFGAELKAWQRFYARRAHESPRRRWSVAVVNEGRTTVTLELVTASGARIAQPARWALNFPLTRPLTPAEQKVADGPRGVEALNATARKFEDFPRPSRPHTGPLELAVDVFPNPRGRMFLVGIVPGDAFDPSIVGRSRGTDEALLRGRRLLKGHNRIAPQALELASARKFQREDSVRGTWSTPRDLTYAEFKRFVMRYHEQVVLRWKATSRDLATQLRQPIDTVIILTGVGR